MALGLHITTHHAKRPNGLIILGDKTRDNGVVSAFSRCQRIGVLRVEGEGPAAVLQTNACAGYDHAGTKAFEVALDQRHHVAIAISRG